MPYRYCFTSGDNRKTGAGVVCSRRVEDHYSSRVRSLLDAVSWGDIDVCFGVVIRTAERTETAPRVQRC